jgi:hypothetical protein
MDRDELEERIRGRRPGDAGFRRGAPLEDGFEPGYVPFQPEPEDALAGREPAGSGAARHVDNTPPEFDAEPPAFVPPLEPPPDAYQPRAPEPPPAAPAPDYAAAAEEEGPAYAAPQSAAREYAPPENAAPQYETPGYAARDYQPEEVDEEYEPEEAYPYAYTPRRGDGGGSRGGGGALPIIGFVALCALALAVGAILAGILGGSDEVGQATPTSTVTASTTPQPTSAESVSESVSPSTNATPEPTDGPVTFADGAVITVQPCATAEMSFDGCDQDGSVVSGDRIWVWIGFEDALGSDTFVLQLRSADETINEQEKKLGEILDCPNRCSGYLIGAAYRDLQPGEYLLVVRRNGDFADSATFRVEP